MRLLGGGALLGADRGLDVRVAFGLLVLALEVFLGHAQVLRVMPELERHVDGGDERA